MAHRGRLALQQKLQEERLVLDGETNIWHQEVQQQQELELSIGQCQEQKEQIEDLQMKLRASIHQNHEVTQYELEELDSVEYERIQQVPKIKNQISLYAKTTGIKWDYHREHLLAGQVVCYNYIYLLSILILFLIIYSLIIYLMSKFIFIFSRLYHLEVY